MSQPNFKFKLFPSFPSSLFFSPSLFLPFPLLLSPLRCLLYYFKLEKGQKVQCIDLLYLCHTTLRQVSGDSSARRNVLNFEAFGAGSPAVWGPGSECKSTGAHNTRER